MLLSGEKFIEDSKLFHTKYGDTNEKKNPKLFIWYSRMVKDFNEANNHSQIKRLLRVLGQDLMSSTNPNVKNGALMGLSSVAVGLGKVC